MFSGVARSGRYPTRMALTRIFRAAGVALVNVLAATALAGCRQTEASQVARAPLTPATMRKDLSAMRADFLERDRSYSPGARAEAEKRIARLAEAADTVGRAYFEVEIARIVALADNGHTGGGAAQRSSRLNHVPIRLVPFGEDFYVLQTDSANADVLGARLLAIDGRPIAALRNAARSLTGGTIAWRDRAVPFVFESPEQMHAIGMAADSGAATYRFEFSDGRDTERRLKADPPDPSVTRTSVKRVMYPELAAGDANRWRTLGTVARAPWALLDPANPFRWRDAPELDGVVIELRQTVDSPGHSIGDFLDEVERMLREKHPHNIVLDLRMNGGGNLNTARDFAQALPSLASGRVFALTSPYTFSAAISTLGYLKQAAPDRVTIVGESVGDRLMFWAEGKGATLPNSGILIGLATERHDYLTGCKPYKDCHSNVVRHPISVPSLQPEIAASWTIGAYTAGLDPAIEAVVEAVGKQPPSSVARDRAKR